MRVAMGWLWVGLVTLACQAQAEMTLNVPYVADADARQALDIYTPDVADAHAPRPVMVFIHGGGWRMGSRGYVQDKPACFNEHGWVFVSIGYRLSPAVVHPEHVKDVAAAVAWVHGHIAEYGGDPQRIHVMGHSAGAHLAALVATDESRLAAHGLPLSAIKGVVLLDGAGYDVTGESRWMPPQMRDLYDQAFTTDEATQRDASPLLHVEAGKGIPPFMVTYVADRLASRQMSGKLAEALREAGGEAELFAAQGQTHATINRAFGSEGHATTEAVMRWLER